MKKGIWSITSRCKCTNTAWYLKWPILQTERHFLQKTYTFVPYSPSAPHRTHTAPHTMQTDPALSKHPEFYLQFKSGDIITDSFFLIISFLSFVGSFSNHVLNGSVYLISTTPTQCWELSQEAWGSMCFFSLSWGSSWPSGEAQQENDSKIVRKRGCSISWEQVWTQSHNIGKLFRKEMKS